MKHCLWEPPLTLKVLSRRNNKGVSHVSLIGSGVRRMKPKVEVLDRFKYRKNIQHELRKYNILVSYADIQDLDLHLKSFTRNYKTPWHGLP